MRTLKLGLALGAGGTKGAAHVGVMKVLDEAGIAVDALAGTSIGALYGAGFAAGRSPQEMEDGIRSCPHLDVINFFRNRLKIRDNNRLARRFYSALAGHRIEELPVAFAAVASDIVERCPVVIDRGPLIDAVEASIAIPFIARPVAHQGRYLLDGGFWDSAPVDAVALLGADVIVAVELGGPFMLPRKLRAPAAVLARFSAQVPLHRTMAGLPFAVHAVSRPGQAGRTAQVVLRPDVGRMNANLPFHMDRAVDAGIEAAREALPAIRALLAGEPVASVVEEFAPAPQLLAEPGTA
ncbi:MAG: patatin-like phospholipase family protein [Dehalococcoidia bacterium]